MSQMSFLCFRECRDTVSAQTMNTDFKNWVWCALPAPVLFDETGVGKSNIRKTIRHGKIRLRGLVRRRPVKFWANKTLVSILIRHDLLCGIQGEEGAFDER